MVAFLQKASEFYTKDISEEEGEGEGEEEMMENKRREKEEEKRRKRRGERSTIHPKQGLI